MLSAHHDPENAVLSNNGALNSIAQNKQQTRMQYTTRTILGERKSVDNNAMINTTDPVKKSASATCDKPAKLANKSETLLLTEENKEEMDLWYTVPEKENDDRMTELEDALRETLEENRTVHELCRKLTRENTELKKQIKELSLVSVLYEVAKKELAELLSVATTKKENFSE